MIAISRALRPFAFSALSVALLLGIGNPVAGQHAVPSARDNQARAVKIERPTTREPAWLYKGSDITPDPAWHFGTLPNGLRYAVRRNGVPPGQVAVRVRIDAGSLFETDSERGFAHLIEHLSFRGSVHVPDGEAKRVWQRLGTTFGSDTNAQTTPTGTTYKLDLPSATTQGLDDSLKILAGMMSQPNITQQALNAERPVVLAEQREQPGPQVRYRDRLSAVFFAGQALADRSPIGTIKALEAASAPEVRAFHDRWYRPERAVVIISGDLDPALFEQLIEKNFSGWKGIGPNPADPDFGKPDPLRPITGSIVEPSLPPSVLFSVLRPWVYRDDTVIFNQRRLVDLVALRLINRRLETRARTGGSFLQAAVELNDISRSVNATFVNVLPAGEDWEAALRDVRATIADAQATPPSQSEIDRELSEFDIAMKTEVDTAPAEGGAKEADDLDQAVDIRETVTTAAVAYDILQDAKTKNMFSADALLAATRRLFLGDVTRAFINTRSVDPAIDSRLALALKADVSGLAAKRKALVKADFSSLPKLGKPGKIIKRTPLPDVNAVQVDFANGARALLFPTAGETSRVYVRVRFGRGYNALPARRQSAAWAGALALVPSGIGKLGQEAIDQLTTGRRIGLSFDIDDDAFVFGYTTSPEDLADQMKLIAAKLAAPGWDPNPLARAKAVSLAAYPGLSSSPSGVLARDLNGLLRDGDPRWLTPTEKQIAATTPAQFRALWEPLLKSGPIEVQLFGDFELEEGVSVVANSIGALPPRRDITPPPPPVRFPAHVTQPVLRTHDGPQNQAVAVIAWPTGGGVEGVAQSRRLELIAQIFSDRLFDRLRSEAGASYSPSVQSSWPEGLADGGRMVAVAQVPPDKVDFFFALAREIAADLAANPVGDDELRRTLLPYFQSIQRSATSNSFWLGLLAGATRDPHVVEQAAGLAKDLGTIDARQLQQVAAKYLQPARDWSMVVLPAKGAGVTAGATGPGVPPGR